MDNAQKAIMIGVGLFITIIIISSVLLISNMGTNLITSAQSQLSGISKGLQNQITAAYDGKTLSGAEVVAAFQQYESSEMSIIVYASESKISNTGKYDLDFSKLSASKTEVAAIASSSSYPGGLYYITNTDYVELPDAEKGTLTNLQANSGLGVNASKTFYSSVIKDATTDTVIGIVFIQRGASMPSAT